MYECMYVCMFVYICSLYGALTTCINKTYYHSHHRYYYYYAVIYPINCINNISQFKPKSNRRSNKPPINL